MANATIPVHCQLRSRETYLNRTVTEMNRTMAALGHYIAQHDSLHVMQEHAHLEAFVKAQMEAMCIKLFTQITNAKDLHRNNTNLTNKNIVLNWRMKQPQEQLQNL